MRAIEILPNDEVFHNELIGRAAQQLEVQLGGINQAELRRARLAFVAVVALLMPDEREADSPTFIIAYLTNINVLPEVRQYHLRLP